MGNSGIGSKPFLGEYAIMVFDDDGLIMAYCETLKEFMDYSGKSYSTASSELTRAKAGLIRSIIIDGRLREIGFDRIIVKDRNKYSIKYISPISGCKVNIIKDSKEKADAWIAAHPNVKILEVRDHLR